MEQTIVLASGSPRRRELLAQIGLRFTVKPANVDERRNPGEAPEGYALRLAENKARAAAQGTRGVVIAADTVVAIDGEILGKPVDAQDADRMLSLLSGREHAVVSGLAVLDVETDRLITRAARTRVWFKTLTSEHRASYIATGEPLDKAGAYGIQERGALLVERIEGCYFNVVGLPLSLLGDMLMDLGIPVWKRA